VIASGQCGQCREFEPVNVGAKDNAVCLEGKPMGRNNCRSFKPERRQDRRIEATVES
jgi:hypothetical protein